MTMNVKLTNGAVRDMISGNHVDKPVLQLLEITRITGTANTERYRLVLSDGTNSCSSAMLAHKLNDKINNGELEPNTVIRVEKFVCHRIPSNGPANKLVVIILELSVVANDPELKRIGNPTPLNLNSLSSNVSCEAESSASKANPPAAVGHSRIYYIDVKLTDGAVRDMLSGNRVDKPVLQLLGISRIAANTERYRLILSDGTNSCASFTGKLATKLNDKINNGELETNTIIRVEKFDYCRILSNKLVVIILELSVVANDPELKRIGNPTPLELNSLSNNIVSCEPDSSASKANASSAALARGNMSSSSNGREPAALSPLKKQRRSKSPAAASFPRDPVFTSNKSNQRQPISQFAGKTHPIATLTPFYNKWTIRARVSNKTSIRPWNNARGKGKRFSTTFVDHTGEIKATAFNAECDKFFPVLQEGKVFYVSNGQVKKANWQYSNVNNNFEIILNKYTVVKICKDIDVHGIPQVQFNFVPIRSLSNASIDDTVDVLGVCKSAGDVRTVMSKANKELKTRQLQLVDKSNAEISLTLWEDDAEKFDGRDNPVLAVKGVRVSEFGGRSLSLLSSSIMQVNPDFNESFALRSWYDNKAVHSDFQWLSSKSGAVFWGPTEWKCLSQIVEDNMGDMGDKAHFYTCKAMVAWIKKEGALYKACAQSGCNKKVVEYNGFYRCEKCNHETTHFKWCLLLNMDLSDYSGSLRATCFHDQAETILGRTAEYLGSLMQSGDDEQVQAAIMEATLRYFVFKLRIRKDNFNIKARFKTEVVTVSEVNSIEYG